MHLLERQDLGGRAAVDRLLGHPEHDAARLVLCDRLRSGPAHLQQAIGAVVAHAGQEDAEGVRGRRPGGRPEQDVDRRAMARDERTILHRHRVAAAPALDHEVTPAGGDQGAAPHHGIAVLRLLDGDRAEAVQALGERRREMLRHVLHDDEAGGLGGQHLEHVAQGLRPTRRRADADDPVGLDHHATGDGRRQDGVGRELRLDQLPGRPAPAQLGPRGRPDRVADPDGGLEQELTRVDPRLRQHVDGPRLQDLEQHPGARPGQGRADDHRERLLRHDLPQEGQSVHAGHLEIEDDDVRDLLLDPAGGDERIGGRSQDLDVGRRLQDAAQGLADGGRVVDHEDADRSGRAHRLDSLSLLKTVEETWSRPATPTPAMDSEWPTIR